MEDKKTYLSDIKGIDLIDDADASDLSQSILALAIQKEMEGLADEGYGWPVDNFIEKYPNYSIIEEYNTYNNGGEDWLDGVYLIKVIKENKTGAEFTCIQKHAGGDVRGNYYTPEVFDGNVLDSVGWLASADAITIDGEYGSTCMNLIYEGKIFVDKKIKSVYDLESMAVITEDGKNPNPKKYNKLDF